ncbi:uncharacterized protein LOC135344363 [Halichondria panicea]|uniref:uncharacterized protein LOC135344363 n=1 Tax=Halichondria panicea TaxID=6063 RepID=UPI00312BC531
MAPLSLARASCVQSSGEKDRSSPPPALEVAVAEMTTGLFCNTYAIPRATTIPADSTEHKVLIALVDLVPELTYSSVPRLSPHSFLQAKATNSSPYTILAGRTSQRLPG